jgi:hypothetical protein
MALIVTSIFQAAFSFETEKEAASAFFSVNPHLSSVMDTAPSKG